jgi:signal transduction histidine kinase
LKHILRHIIENAVKFTERGHVKISSRFCAARGKVEFVISDTGIGIAGKSLPGVFEKFKRTDASFTRSNDGLGLGLYIAKKFIELLGGEIKVSSELGKGSIFKVALPCGWEMANGVSRGPAASRWGFTL